MRFRGRIGKISSAICLSAAFPLLFSIRSVSRLKTENALAKKCAIGIVFAAAALAAASGAAGLRMANSKLAVYRHFLVLSLCATLNAIALVAVCFCGDSAEANRAIVHLMLSLYSAPILMAANGAFVWLGLSEKSKTIYVEPSN